MVLFTDDNLSWAPSGAVSHDAFHSRFRHGLQPATPSMTLMGPTALRGVQVPRGCLFLQDGQRVSPGYYRRV
ncbi:uncharacterized protein ARMOST_20388 [Armillaria ostoyae]|uniref:Uncharacterized protein n=1 Tax=Armillaria ostoyae TaxID=47428 RepID=A0A284S771_ARMOS|nr:uncharacterized protein ARMOST_20388 [Armillaria ostoyae]